MIWTADRVASKQPSWYSLWPKEPSGFLQVMIQATKSSSAMNFEIGCPGSKAKAVRAQYTPLMRKWSE